MPVAIGVSPYNKIAVINSSTYMSDTDGTNIVDAINILLPKFCTDWNIKPVTAIYVAKGNKSPCPLGCVVLDDTDSPGALGYHDESNDIPYAKVFVKTILSYKGVMLYSTDSSVPTVSGTISHEIFELLIDFNANIWWNSATGTTLYAAEVCDPVQSNIVAVSLPKNPSIKIAISDWILPAWADPGAKIGPFNHNNTLKSPFTIDRGGYLIVLKNGSVKNIFGNSISDYTKNNMCTRVMNRKNKIKCENTNCTYIKHTDDNNNGGTHCCLGCKNKGIHGPLCEKVQFK